MTDKTELLGDKLEKLLNKIGADKIAKTYEQITKRPCKCKERKEFLNKLHQQLQEMQNIVMKTQKTNATRK